MDLRDIAGNTEEELEVTGMTELVKAGFNPWSFRS